MKKGNTVALLPIGVFLVIYLGLGIVFVYVLKISMGFYKIPIVVAFLVALLVACLQNRALSFDEKLELMGKGIGDKNIVTMILIFMAAGIFVPKVRQRQAESGETLSRYMTALITKFYEMEENVKMDKDNVRTVAFQVPTELFEQLKAYLKRNGIKQNAFFLDCIRQALAEDTGAAEE